MFTVSIVSLHRSLDLVVRPVPSSSAAQGDSWQSPCSASTSFMAPSPLKPNMLGSISQKNFSGASELNLLETPLVVKVCVLKNRINQPKQKPVNFVSHETTTVFNTDPVGFRLWNIFSMRVVIGRRILLEAGQSWEQS